MSEKELNIEAGSVYEARLINARKLSESLGPSHGSQAALASMLSLSPSRITHIIGPNPTKRIGEEMARKIEHAFEKPVYWLDQFHDQEYDDPENVGEDVFHLPEILRVNQRLVELGLKWSDLARGLETNDQRVYNWRIRGLPKAELVKVSDFLQCSIDWLLTGSEFSGGVARRVLAPSSSKSSTMNEVLLQRLLEAHEEIGQLKAQLKSENPV